MYFHFSLPTYRYSSLKTEVNGLYGPDDKMESQMLVTVSTEEEDDFDDDDDEEDVSNNSDIFIVCLFNFCS